MIGKWIGGAVGEAAKGTGEAVSTVWATVKGDKSAAEQHIHDEQMAVLQAAADEAARRSTATWWDSFVDGLSRLPRPIFTFGVIGLFAWSVVAPQSFIEGMQALALVPEEVWLLLIAIVAFWFGGRLVKDIRQPQVAVEQIKMALDLARSRAERIRNSERVARPAAPVVLLPSYGPSGGPKEIGDAAVVRMIGDLISREGGYVDHPSDRGGPTKYGITLATLATHRNRSVTAHDVQALTREEAEKIYRNTFYLAAGIDRLPPDLQTHVFDISVNCGPKTAARLLQRALNSLGAEIIEDGVIGPATTAAARKYTAQAVHDALVKARLKFYDEIVASRPDQMCFLGGWRKRANAFLV